MFAYYFGEFYGRVIFGSYIVGREIDNEYYHFFEPLKHYFKKDSEHSALI